MRIDRAIKLDRAIKNSPFYMAVVHTSVIPGGTEGSRWIG